MLQNIKEKFSSSKTQLLTLYLIEVFLLTATYLVYKSYHLNDRWPERVYNSTNFAYTQYQLRKKFEGAYWQLGISIGVLNHTFVNKGDAYPSIPLYTLESCWAKQHGDPDLDSQYEDLGVYEGLISNKEVDSVFGNLGLLLWQFKYSRAGNVESVEMVLNSSLNNCTMNLHIPVQERPNPHEYKLTGDQNVSFNPADIIVSRSFHLVNETETLNGSMSTRINLIKLRQQVLFYKVKLAEKHSGIVYIDNLDESKPSLSKQVAITLGSTTIEFVVTEQFVAIKAEYINSLYILAFMLLIGLIPIYQRVSAFYQSHIAPIDSINSVLKQRLNYSFQSGTNSKHNLIAANQELIELCQRCSQLPSYSIEKHKVQSKETHSQQFYFTSKLNQIAEKFKAKAVSKEYQTMIYNNRFVIKINEDFEQEKKVLKGLFMSWTNEEFFKASYLCICCRDEREFSNILNNITNKYTLKREQKTLFQRFYYRFHSESLQELRAKIRGETEKEIESDKDLAEDLCYFEGLHIHTHGFSKSPYSSTYYERAFFERVQKMVLSRFLAFIKDCDKDLKYLKELGLESRIGEVELDVENLRYQMTRKQEKERE